MRSIAAALVFGLVATQSTWATLTPVNTVGEGSDVLQSLQSLINARNNTLVNIQSDADQLDNGTGAGQDGWWNGLGSESATVIVEVAGWNLNNRFGYYNALDPSQKVELFPGSASAGSTISFTPAYSTFGWYMKNDVNSTFTWFSDSTLNTSDNKDHMVAYAGKGETLNPPNVSWGANDYLLGWEDTQGLGDWDYQDMVLIVKNVTPVPDSGSTLALLGAGLVGVGLLRRKLA